MARGRSSGKNRAVFVTGLDAIDRKLRGLPNSLGKRVVTKAMRKESGLMRSKVRANAPKMTGLLKRQIKSRQLKSRKSIAFEVYIAWKGIVYFADGFYPAFQEYGWETPGGGRVEGKRYMKEAYDANRVASRNRMIQRILVGINEEVRKLAAKRG